MIQSTQAISELRRRMIDDMRMRKFADKTQSHYLRWVERFAACGGRIGSMSEFAPPKDLMPTSRCVVAGVH
jgi:hypothetical protein